jgi:hypothetical protein
MLRKLNLSSRAAAVTLSALVIGAAVSACGSGGAANSSTSSPAAGSTAGGSNARFEARLNLAKCMRTHGINVPDPSASGTLGDGAVAILRNYPRSQIEGALTACRQYVVAAFPALNLTPAQRAARTAALVRFAECMRSHGVNIPDPTTAGGGPLGGGFGLRQAFKAQLANSPAFQAANHACASLRPHFGRFAIASGGPAPSSAGASGG